MLGFNFIYKIEKLTRLFTIYHFDKPKSVPCWVSINVMNQKHANVNNVHLNGCT
jgi:hypothetical protein